MATVTSSRSFTSAIRVSFHRMPVSIGLCCTGIAIVLIIGVSARWAATYLKIRKGPN
jgi:peptide/nickel transport system permease protein